MGSVLERLDRRWGLVLLGVLTNMCLGTVYSWSVFREPLVATYGFSTAQTGAPYSVFLALFAFTMPIGGWLQGRIGARATLAIGGALVGTGWITAGSVSTIPALAATYGVVGGLGVGLAYGVPLAVVGSWFPGKRGLALGITLVGFGLSPFVTAPVAEILLERSGPAVAFRALGAAFLVIVLAVSGFFRRAPERATGEHDAAPVPARVAAPESAGSADSVVSPAEMLRHRSFWGLWITFAFGTFAGLTAIGMSAAYGIEVVGLAPAVAAAAVSAFGVFNGAGRPLFGWVTDRIGARRAAVIAYVVIIAASALAVISGINGATSGAGAWYVAGFALLWLTLGGWLAIAPAATASEFGQRHYATNYGIMYTAYGVGALSGGGASGALTLVTGSLVATFYAIAGVAVLGILTALLLLPRTRDGR